METKKCTKCDETKTRDKFSVNNAMKDGLQSQCRKCKADYRNQPEVKKRLREHAAKRRKRPEVKKKNAAYEAERRKRPEVKKRLRENSARYRRNRKPEAKKRVREWKAEWARKNPMKIKQQQKMTKYGLDEDAYLELFEKQGYACGICTKKIEAYTTAAHVDHVHIEGYNKLKHDEKRKHIRGVLCPGCNTGIGCFGDDADGMSAALKWLQKPEVRWEEREWKAELQLNNHTKEKQRQKMIKYGLDKISYLALFDEQEYTCGICKKELEPYTKEACVDHDHVGGFKTMKPNEKRKHVRGILCKLCNRGVGLLGDDERLVTAALEYLL